MSRNSMVLWRIAGSVVGLLVGGAAVGGAVLGLILSTVPADDPSPASTSAVIIIFGGLGCVIGAIVGTAVGVAIMQKLLRRRTSFWRALLGTIVGLLAGGPLSLPLLAVFEHLRVAGWVAGAPIILISMVAGAVIGSDWKAKADDAASSGS